MNTTLPIAKPKETKAITNHLNLIPHINNIIKAIEFNTKRVTCICLVDAELKQQEPIQQTQHIPIIFYLLKFYFN